MHSSIRIRIMNLTMTAILISVFALGSMSIISMVHKSKMHSEEKMRLLCDNCSRTVDDYLSGIEQSVDIISNYATGEFDSVQLFKSGLIGVNGLSGTVQLGKRDCQQGLDRYLSEYVARIESAFCGVAKRTNGVVSFYYRINPELSGQENGFLYSRIGNSSFTKTPLTNLENYGEDDVGHTGWYYLPIKRGCPSWLEPYDNRNLRLKMISYVTPVYKAGTLLGVVGMDIPYETLVSQLREIRVYDTGFAFLTKDDGTVIYHPKLESGVDIIGRGANIPEGVTQLNREAYNTEPIVIEVGGEERQMYFNTLSSGMKLFVSAPVREINLSGRQLAGGLTLIAIAILLVFSTLTAMLMHRLTDPLKRLTAAAVDLADGNYDVRMDYSGDDEIGILTRAFQRLVEHLRIHISDLNSKAYQDAMTGVRNKGAYMVSAQKIDDAIRMSTPGEPPKFALVMFDCNNLKKINDTYGHEKGDTYLTTACKLICDVFQHSPVFRVGGDEFTVILQTDAYEQREVLLAQFDRLAAAINARAENPWERIHIARGVAAFDPVTDKSTEDVLHRADKRMYINKKRSREARGSENETE